MLNKDMKVCDATCDSCTEAEVVIKFPTFPDIQRSAIHVGPLIYLLVVPQFLTRTVCFVHAYARCNNNNLLSFTALNDW